MKIAADVNQFSGSHGASNRAKHKQMERLGIEVIPLPLPFGDYTLVNEKMEEILSNPDKRPKKSDFNGLIDISIDTKKNLEEIWMNVNGKQHDRFRRELIKARDNNAKLVILIEHGPEIKSLEDVMFYDVPGQKRVIWKTKKMCGANCRVSETVYQNPIIGMKLYKALCTIRDRYNVDFYFCQKHETGKKIVEILTNGNSGRD